ncbi:MAG: hypothetical protein IPL32_03775 [Chloracidobacterium sp.]|nr:hypothetical protein [Chloracidobacterium sp.]
MDGLLTYLPKWTQKVVTEGGGRDPLGLSRVAFLLTDALLTGIITTTDRARYYSFYTWALWHIEKEDKPQRYEYFVDGLRRREAALALATANSEPQMTPVGRDVVRVQLDRGSLTGEFNCDFKVLPSNNTGGYGQYYSGSIYNLGLSRRDDHGIDLVSDGLGDQLATAFHESIAESAYIKNRLYTRTSLSKAEVESLSERYSLQALSSDAASTERNLLLDIFFSQSDGGSDQKSLLRRQTLTILLDLVAKYSDLGSPPDTSSQDKLDVYLLYAIYYDSLWTDEYELIPYTPPATHEFCYEMWKQFCLHEFVVQSIEGLLQAVLITVGDEFLGRDLTSVIEEITDDEFQETFREVMGQRCETPLAFLRALGLEQIPRERESAKFQKQIEPNHDYAEPALLSLATRIPGRRTALSVMLLGVLYAKWRGVLGSPSMSYISNHAGANLWAGAVLPELDSWFSPDALWSNVLPRFIERFILDQHDRVMYEKRRLDSCWLHRADNRIIKDQDYDPQWRASRFLNSIRILSDLGLIETSSDKRVEITKEGRDLLRQLITSDG